MKRVEAYRTGNRSIRMNFTPAIYNLALSLERSWSSWSEGLELLESLRARDPQNLMVLRGLGRMSLQSGKSGGQRGFIISRPWTYSKPMKSLCEL